MNLQVWLVVAFLFLAGGMCGWLCSLGAFRNRTKQMVESNDAYRNQFLDLQRQLRDLTLEQISICTDNVKNIHMCRQEDVTLYVNRANAALQLVNELQSQVNAAIYGITNGAELSPAVKIKVEEIRATAEEMRGILNEIKFVDLDTVLESMNGVSLVIMDQLDRMTKVSERVNAQTRSQNQS
jgi:hypothetical protein